MNYFDKDWGNISNLSNEMSMYQWKSLLIILMIYLISMPPLKKISKRKLKSQTNLWITPALQKSISIENVLLRRNITLKALSKRMKNTNNINTTEITFQH